jgi:predicted nucleic acid-binding protein
MTVRSFLDTNILVYTDDLDAPDKQAKALALFEDLRTTRHGVVSTQVLQEYFAAATKRLSVDPAIARQKVELFARLDLV